jgi:nitrogen fixation NifU-like protein
MDIYREAILEHYHHPRHWGILSPADVDHEENNPLCGDRLRLTLRLEGGTIVEVGWDGDGCAISQASASMLGERLLGKTLEAVRVITKADILAMLGVSPGPARMNCALLPLKVLKIGVFGLSNWD